MYKHKYNNQNLDYTNFNKQISSFELIQIIFEINIRFYFTYYKYFF